MSLDPYSVVIPAYQAGATLPHCLDALAKARPAPDEVIVFDDGSHDETGAIAEAWGATVLRNDGPNKGPAHGRNAGVVAASTDIVVFVDADVSVCPDAPGRLSSAVGESEDVVAAFGAYGDVCSKQVTNMAGRYANLRHHHVHMDAAGKSGVSEASTFWSGLGAVDRTAFLAAGGFDEDYEKPCIEDVELGLRMREAGGRVMLVAAARGDHMKDWTLKQLWRTDVLQRAVPWSHLIADGRISPTLNTGSAERTKSGAAHLVWLLGVAALLALPFSGVVSAVLGLGAVAAGAVYVLMNRRFLRLLGTHSVGTAVAGGGLHWLYHCYASLTYVFVLARAGFAARMRRKSVGERAAALS